MAGPVGGGSGAVRAMEGGALEADRAIDGSPGGAAPEGGLGRGELGGPERLVTREGWGVDDVVATVKAAAGMLRRAKVSVMHRCECENMSGGRAVVMGEGWGTDDVAATVEAAAGVLRRAKRGGGGRRGSNGGGTFWHAKEGQDCAGLSTAVPGGGGNVRASHVSLLNFSPLPPPCCLPVCAGLSAAVPGGGGNARAVRDEGRMGDAGKEGRGGGRGGWKGG
ncbi:unnamed protein product [Closterium sp. Naga37s-1]|nr:unnamed protein product [Closterium sp. Naga37s-1]